VVSIDISGASGVSYGLVDAGEVRELAGPPARKLMMDMVVAGKSQRSWRDFMHSSPEPEDQCETTTVVPTVTRW
jgi:hypothetical protein